MELLYPWLQVIPAVSDEPAHDHSTMYGAVPELAAKATWADREVYISGPDHMIVKTARVLRERGAPTASSTTTWTRRPARASSRVAGLAQVRAEEREDPLPGVLGRALVVLQSRQLGEWRHRGRLRAHEAVPGLGVHLDVVRHPQRGQRGLEPLRRRDAHRVPAAVAPDDRARAGQRRLGVGGDHTVIDRRGGVLPAWRAQQREAAAHAEADHPGLAGAVGARGQPAAARVQDLEGRTRPGLQLPEHAADAAQPELAVEQVGCQRQVAERGQPVRVGPGVRVQAERLVDHHHARPRSLRAMRYGEVGGRGPDRDISHRYTLRQPGTQVPSSVTV